MYKGTRNSMPQTHSHFSHCTHAHTRKPTQLRIRSSFLQKNCEIAHFTSTKSLCEPDVHAPISANFHHGRSTRALSENSSSLLLLLLSIRGNFSVRRVSSSIRLFAEKGTKTILKKSMERYSVLGVFGIIWERVYSSASHLFSCDQGASSKKESSDCERC